MKSKFFGEDTILSPRLSRFFIKTLDESERKFWILFGESEDKKNFFRSSFEKNEDGIINIWWKTESKEIVFNKNVYKNSYDLRLVALSCKENKIAIIEGVTYDSKGNVITSTIYEDLKFMNIIPESTGEVFKKYVCTVFN